MCHGLTPHDMAADPPFAANTASCALSLQLTPALTHPCPVPQTCLQTNELQYPIGMSSPSLAEEACKPLRPAYAADLRDSALAAAGYQLSDVVRSPVQFTFNRCACVCVFLCECGAWLCCWMGCIPAGLGDTCGLIRNACMWHALEADHMTQSYSWLSHVLCIPTFLVSSVAAVQREVYMNRVLHAVRLADS